MSLGLRNIFLIGFTVVLLLCFYLRVNYKQQTLLPFEYNSPFTYAIFHEGPTEDFSSAKVNVDSGKIQLKYQLTSAMEEPFTGFYICKKDTSHNLFSIEGYNTVKIHLKASSAKRIPLSFTVDYKGFTSVDKPLSSMPFTTVVDYTGEKEYEIPLSDFTTPSWWFRQHGLTEKDFKNPDFNRVNYFVVSSGQEQGKGAKGEIEVSALEFAVDNAQVYLIFGVIAFVGYGAFGLSFLLSRRKKILVPYIANEIPDEVTDKTSAIVNYLSKNYNNPELTQIDVQRELGISAREIGQLLKDNHHSSFKNYLNQIRLAEVKRLLKESEIT
ncbi:MAG: hypothetical protein ACKOXB_07585 [Flavobacteriales bacterium]